MHPRHTPATGWRAILHPAILPAYATSAARALRRSWLGPRRFPSDAAQICRAVIEACWDGHRLAASAGHFRQFWIRDLGMSAGALVQLGQRDRVEASLAWALETWAPRGHVTTTIFAGRRPADVYAYGVDSLPWLFHALRACGAETLLARHAGWLAAETEHYVREVVDPRSNLVRDDRRFSMHRDTVRLGSNCYANTMLALLSRTLGETDWLPDPVPAGSAGRLVDAFWRGDHFSDVAGKDEPTGDASVWPFFAGVVPPELGRGAALRWLAAEGYASPLPLRYTLRREPALEDPIQRLFVPDYQGTAIWTSLGAIYLAMLDADDPDAATPGIEAYRRLIERDGTFWEVLVAAPGVPRSDAASGRRSAAQPSTGHAAGPAPLDDVRPYRGRLGLFHADEAMLWSAVFLRLLEQRAAREALPVAVTAPPAG